jgi:hypothetical protein
MRKIQEPKKLLHKWASPLTMVDVNDPVAVSGYFEARDKAQLEEDRKVAEYNECVRQRNEEYNRKNPIIEYNGMYIRQSELREEFFRRKYIGGGDNQDWTKYE